MIKVYGASDDLVEIEGDVRDEIGSTGGGQVIIGDEAGGIRIVAKYAVAKGIGVWRLGVEPIDEDVPVPWPVRVEQTERGYSLAVIVDCPPGTPVKATRLKAASR